MQTKITTYKGYTIVYESGAKEFHLLADDGEPVASAKTQDELEHQADKIVKLSFPFPIPALEVSGRTAKRGRVTSLNPSDRSIRFAYNEKSHWQSHSKCHLRYGHSSVYEATDHNQAIAVQLDDKEAHIRATEEEMRELLKGLEKPMDLAYFNLDK